MKLNIFVLHYMGDFSSARKTSIDHALCFERYGGDHNFYYHDVFAPISEELKTFPFDAVIFDTTALCIRYFRPRSLFTECLERLSFIADWKAVKVAFPQDDYDHGAILDRWLDRFGFDTVYSVVWDHRELIYPLMLKRGKVLSALTGYVNDGDIERLGTFRRPYADRKIDIGYRARFLPAQFGSYGQMKGVIAGVAEEAFGRMSFKTDISTNPKEVFLGEDWLRFLGDCRFNIGSEGGSSLWDPEGEFTDAVREYTTANPEASFDETAAACLQGQDRKYVFSAVSPRLFEAAMIGCGQLLIEAPYLGVLKPWEHYIPLAEDCSNAAEVADAIRDVRLAESMIDKCFEALVEVPDFRYSTQARRVMADIEAQVRTRDIPHEDDNAFAALLEAQAAAAAAAPPPPPPPSLLRRIVRRARRVLASL